MSDSIPWDIQTEIIKRDVPVKSLIRFRSVCKQWKSLIDSSEFITHHTLNTTHQHHVLIRYSVSHVQKCVSVVDNDDHDHTFPQYNCSIPVPPGQVMLDSSHGLVFLFGYTLEANKMAGVWNPSIRKYVDIAPPPEATVVGFGVCPKTSDPKIFAITGNSQAQVFTLSTRAWRSVPMNMFGTSFEFSYNQVVIDGVIHSGAYDQNAEYRQRIITFDLTSEEFGEVVLPDSLVGYQCARISKFKESLAVTAYHEDPAGKPFYDIWVMRKNGVSKSTFTKLFTITDDSKSLSYNVIGFRKNGQPVVERYLSLEKELEVYEPNSNNMTGIGIHGTCFDMVNYTESLLLFNDHSASIIE